MVKKELVFGLGKSGLAVVEVAKALKLDVLVYDDEKAPFSVDPDQIERIILSPGVLLSHPRLQEWKRPVISEIDWALEKIGKRKLIGVTGSNGKSTLVSLIAEMLTLSGRSAKAFGNIGLPLSLAYFEPEIEWIVVELSAQQLETTQTALFDVAVLLNVLPNHLDRYKTLEDYRKVKEKIFTLLHNEGIALPFPMSPSEALAQIAAHYSLDPHLVGQVLKNFRPLPHRLQCLDTVLGKKWYNDSKSTNLSATLFALQQMSLPVQLILGGRDKGETLDLMESSLDRVDRILAIGEMGEQIYAKFHLKIEVVVCFTVLDAVLEAAKGKKDVLFSPGFPSYDQYRSFEERGADFMSGVEWVKKMQF